MAATATGQNSGTVTRMTTWVIDVFVTAKDSGQPVVIAPCGIGG